jgi:hypothetical protein
MKKWIVRLCAGTGAVLAFLGTGRPARADCWTIYSQGQGLYFSCDSTEYNWKPCETSMITFDLSGFGSAFSSCVDAACSSTAPVTSVNQCMIGSPTWACGTCP